MNPQTTRLTIELDTDQNSSTGITGASGLGIDYIIDLCASRPNQTLVQQAMPMTCSAGGTCYDDVGTASLILGADTMSATLWLAMLWNATGRMNFHGREGSRPQASPQTTESVARNLLHLFA